MSELSFPLFSYKLVITNTYIHTLIMMLVALISNTTDATSSLYPSPDHSRVCVAQSLVLICFAAVFVFSHCIVCPLLLLITPFASSSFSLTYMNLSETYIVKSTLHTNTFHANSLVFRLMIFQWSHHDTSLTQNNYNDVYACQEMGKSEY